jgi:putative transposase
MQTAEIGNKYRIYPTKAQISMINQTMGCCRMIYNWGLAKQKETYEQTKTKLSQGELYTLFTKLREEKEYLKDVPTIAVSCVLRDLDKAYSNFFKKRAAFPKFKRKQTKESFTVQINRKNIDIANGAITLPKIGKVKCIYHRDILGTLDKPALYVTVTRTTTYQYYISFKSEIYMPDSPTAKATEDNTIGVDLGVKDLAITDQGVKYGKVGIDRKLDKRIKHLQRRLSKKTGSKKGEAKSHSYIKLQMKLNRLNEQKARRREHYQYNIAKELTNNNCLYIGLENLNVKGMSRKGGARKKGLNRGMANNALYTFKQRIEFKARRSGKLVVYVDRFFPSSKTCHCCGYKKVDLKLSDRLWTCPECGAKLDRDTNAGTNLKNEAIRLINNQ